MKTGANVTFCGCSVHNSFSHSSSLSLFLCVADMYLLSEGPESYHYLSQAGCVQDSSLDDKQLFDFVMVSQFV